jgi:hypothetical protein
VNGEIQGPEHKNNAKSKEIKVKLGMSGTVDIKVRMIKFWCKLIIGKQSKLSHICYKLLYNKKCLRDVGIL